ncbi:MAG: hypothetical protein ACI8QC_000506 [Planctomycetota bacterium]|jgi:hypothetical protein
MGQPARLHFLGWGSSPLEAAAHWLLELDPEDLAQRLVALPGGRAGRRLLAKLAAAAPPDWIPPRILTQGALVDALVQLDAPPADRLTRTLAWAEALRDAPTDDQQCLLARPPQDLAGWLTLAERIRSLHAELAVEGRDFAWIAAQLEQEGHTSEARRWNALAAAQEVFRARLREEQLLDPHEARLQAAVAGRVQADASVVLVGISDVGGLLGHALDALEQAPDALVFAPESEAAGFDSHGSVQTEHWIARDLPMDLDAWHVVEGPAGQVEASLAATAGRQLSGAVSFGMCDDEVTPLLAERLHRAQVGARVAAGTALLHTRPHALLHDTAAFLDDPRQAPLASLVRQPDMGAYLMSKDPGAKPVTHLDRHFQKHLPWLIDADHPPLGKPVISDPIKSLLANLRQVLGELSSSKTRVLSEWAESIRQYLAAIFGGSQQPTSPHPERLAGALDAVSAGLASWEDLPKSLAPKVSAGQALALLLEGLKAAYIPPSAGSEFDAEAELLGWLELPLDDAPTLILSGMQDGRVPETVRGDAFLPDSLRGSLGLVDDARRMARDLFALTLLTHSRELVLISGKHSQGGESLQASRLFFHTQPAQVVERMHHYLSAEGDPARCEFGQATIPAAPERREPEFSEPTSMAVTSFRNYIESPRRYHLSNVLRLETLDDRAREMDPRLYGTVVHKVLECLGQTKLSMCQDADVIRAALSDELDRVAQQTFGPDPLPTVRLQLAQMNYRFSIFADKQAAWTSQGWQVKHVEWPERGDDGTEMRVDDKPILVRGSIDRIDYNLGKNQWAIWDYKTGTSGLKPDTAHLTKDNDWKDLQLPLYTHLAESLGLGETPILGYIYLGRSESDIGFRKSTKLDDDTVADAFKKAHAVVRDVRDGKVEDIGKWKPKDPIFAGIVGLGLLEDDAEEGE